jgi:hypothetical protein
MSVVCVIAILKIALTGGQALLSGKITAKTYKFGGFGVFMDKIVSKYQCLMSQRLTSQTGNSDRANSEFTSGNRKF